MPLPELIPCWYCEQPMLSSLNEQKRYCSRTCANAAAYDKRTGISVNGAPLDANGNPLPDPALTAKLRALATA